VMYLKGFQVGFMGILKVFIVVSQEVIFMVGISRDLGSQEGNKKGEM